MLYPCMLCVALLMCLCVLCIACLTVFVNYLVKQFAMCLGVVAILLLNVMDVFSVCGGALLDRPCYLLTSVTSVTSVCLAASIWPPGHSRSDRHVSNLIHRPECC